MSDILSFEEYENDKKTQSAVERQLAIIGEAANKFKQSNPNQVLKFTKEIVAFRNRIIHAYDRLDNSIIWTIIKQFLDPLKQEVKGKIKL